MANRESDYSRPTVKGRKMRTGYTTGSCAAAASKAAVQSLLVKEPVSEVTIHLPVGEYTTFQIHRCEFLDGGKVLCSVIKDGGDDPDATSGAEICSTVSLAQDSGDRVTLKGGPGLGTVTKPGIGIPVGDASITRVPRRMITQAVIDAADGLKNDSSFVVEISVPGGEEIAKKTDNPRLGIMNGISILGTTGVVQPFSTAAWRASVNVSIDVAAANDLQRMVISTGTQSEAFTKPLLDLPDMAYVNVGIFTGSALKRCVQRSIGRATLVGMVGKFSKLGMGYFVTHVAGNKVDPDFLTSLAAECGASPEVQAEMRLSTTARHFQEIAQAHGVMDVFDLICRKVCEESKVYVGEKGSDLIVDSICFDFEGNVLGKATTDDEPLQLIESASVGE